MPIDVLVLGAQAMASEFRDLGLGVLSVGCCSRCKRAAAGAFGPATAQQPSGWNGSPAGEGNATRILRIECGRGSP